MSVRVDLNTRSINDSHETATAGHRRASDVGHAFGQVVEAPEGYTTRFEAGSPWGLLPTAPTDPDLPH